jgi:hypothetical protein
MSKKQTTKNLIRARLIEQGTNTQRWAAERGYKEGVVGKIIDRFAGLDERPRPGTQSRQIIDDLEADTGVRICG